MVYSSKSTDRLVRKIAEQKEELYKALAVVSLPAPGIEERLGECLQFLYREIRETSLPFMQEWTKQEVRNNLSNVKNCRIL